VPQAVAYLVVESLQREAAWDSPAEACLDETACQAAVETGEVLGNLAEVTPRENMAAHLAVSSLAEMPTGVASWREQAVRNMPVEEHRRQRLRHQAL